jgi:hypothetical protein
MAKINAVAQTQSIGTHLLPHLLPQNGEVKSQILLLQTQDYHSGKLLKKIL